jgi:transposase
MYQDIQKYKKKGYMKSEISRKLGLDPGTVAKYYSMREEEYREYVGALKDRGKTFDEYKEAILEVYEQNGYTKLLISSVYDYLEERYGELPGTEKTLRNYIGYLRKTNQLELKENIRIYGTVAELPYGKQLQLDFGEHTTASGLTLYIFASVLSASRYKYVTFQTKPFTTLDLIGHLLDCFDYIGGIVEELVIDQDNVMVVSENHGDIIYTKDFSYFIQEMGLRMWVCRKGDPESKGRVENLIKYVKGNFFGTRDFTTLEEAQESVAKWLRRRANGKLSQATTRIPLEDIEEEREHLRPLRNSIYRKESLLGREERLADENAMISVDASLYSVPGNYRKRRVEIYQTERKLFVFDQRTGEQIEEHELSLIPGTKVIKRSSYRKNGKSTQEMKEEVLGKFPSAKWGEFVQRNFKRYSRYVRDQCIEAQRWFGQKVDPDSLEKALEFCLEHKTYSIANLHDTYLYYQRLKDKGEKDLLSTVRPQLKEISCYRRGIQVAQRDIGVYTSFLKVLMGVVV